MTDLDKARRIVATREQWVAEPGDLEEIIAIAVAEGIALGRKEGLAIAAELLGKTRDCPPCHPFIAGTKGEGQARGRRDPIGWVRPGAV